MATGVASVGTSDIKSLPNQIRIIPRIEQDGPLNGVAEKKNKKSILIAITDSVKADSVKAAPTYHIMRNKRKSS